MAVRDVALLREIVHNSGVKPLDGRMGGMSSLGMLNEHVHFHVCGVDGVFEEAAGDGDADADDPASSPGVIFHPAGGLDADAATHAQQTLGKRILSAFVAWGLLEGFEAKEMLAYRHSCFSVDASVCIAAPDRAGLERLLRYCARPPFANERLRKTGRALVYRCAKQRSGPANGLHKQRGAKDKAADELHLTPLEPIERMAALIPLPRTHRHSYFGVLAPNSPLRAAVTALAQGAAEQAAQPPQVRAEPAQPVSAKRPAHLSVRC